MSLRAPLAKVLNHGAAHDGVNHWWVQRVTALALAPLVIWLLWQLLSLPDANYLTVTAWIRYSWNAVLLSFVVLLASWHGWLGLQMVIEDYEHRFRCPRSRCWCYPRSCTRCWRRAGSMPCCASHCGASHERL
jgi:succinate dehydrogenase / fumarate reductase membrane anchor subunit